MGESDANTCANTCANTSIERPAFYWNCATGDGSDIAWTNFITLEIVPVIIEQDEHDTDKKKVITIDRPEKATHWSIYGRWASGDSDVLHDASTRVEALLYAAEASVVSGLPLQVLATEGRNKASPTLIRSFLDLSTAHLKEATTHWLSSNFGTFESEAGYVVWVPGDLSAADHPEELMTMFKAALGVADYIMFDRDAPTDPRFPIYDW